MAKKILIIDDDPDILEILCLIFEGQGYEVILSLTGDETDNLDTLKPDLILLDIRLNNPLKNGITICMWLKSQPLTHTLPVILVSAEKDIGLIAINCGANDFISKPFDVKQLEGKVRHYLTA